jgi:hypothetical protein
MKKFYKQRALLLMLPTLALLAGCVSEEASTENEPAEVLSVSENYSTISIDKKNKLLNEYALVLARAMLHEELRNTIHVQASRKFDGDFDVLVRTLESTYLDASNCSVKELMVQVQKEECSRLRSSLVTLIDSSQNALTKAIPNVQVSVPVHCEDWNPDTQIPWVAVLPYDYQEKPGNTITAYDADGNIHTLSADEEPTFPILVVGRSERVDESGKLDTAASVQTVTGASAPRLFRMNLVMADYPETLILTHGSARSLLLEWTDVSEEIGYEVWRMTGTTFEKITQTGCNDNNFVDVDLNANVKYWYKVRAVTTDGYSSWSPVMATTASNRTDNEWLKIKGMRFSSSALKAVEQWMSGSPEIRLRIVQGSENGATNVFTSGVLEPGKRSYIDDSWWNREITIFSWSTSVYGTVLTFDWREEDWYDNVDFTLTGSYEDKKSGGTVKVGGSIIVKNDDGGDVIGNTSVMWWQDKNQLYDLSGFQWLFTY